MKKLTTEQFIEKATKIHNNKYDYSKVNYINAHSKIIIICNITNIKGYHGEFLMTPNGHLNGYECPTCSSLKKTNNEFLIRAKEIHGNKFEYLSEYKGRNHPITFKCLNCNQILTQKAEKHLKWSGCFECFGSLLKSSEEFISQAKEIHNDKYDYSKTEYTGSLNLITIICYKHGPFQQFPNNHLKGHECKKCANEKMNLVMSYSSEEFITLAKNVHKNDDGSAKYIYDKINYINSKVDIEIICIKHGEFWQRPSHHLAGSHCPSCQSYTSKSEIEWLDALNINDRQVKLFKNRKIKADGFDSNTNTVYEFLGDYWHGNPEIYKSTDYHPESNLTFGELFKNWKDKLDLYDKANYQVISIWESEWKAIKKQVKENNLNLSEFLIKHHQLSNRIA